MMMKVKMMVPVLLLVFVGVANAGLKVHLPLDGDFLDTATADGAQNGTLVDGALGQHEFVSAINGQGLRLGGMDSTGEGNDYVAIDYVLTDEGSIAFFYKANAMYNYNSVIDSDGYQNDWEIWVYGNGELSARQNYGDSFLRDFYIEQDEWYHIAWTWARDADDPSKVDTDLYVDGELVASLTGTGWDEPSSKIFIGGGHTYNDGAEGVYDDFRIYDHALSGAEVQMLVPEPTSLAILSVGGLFAAYRRRK